MRTISLLLACSLTLSMTAAQANSATSAQFVISGSGFGHGVGMSQVGAFVQASKGKTAVEIINSYYPNAPVISVDDSVPILVNIAHLQDSIELASAHVSSSAAATELALLQITNNQGLNIKISKPVVVLPNLSEVKVVFKDSPNEVLIQGSNLSISWMSELNGQQTSKATDLVITPSKGSVAKHRFGPLKLSVSNTKLNASLERRISDDYLNAVAEVASTWPAAALKAQAIASRSVAMAALLAGSKTKCGCHLFNSGDQNMRGSERYTLPGYVNWRTAVAATKGQVISYNSLPVTAWFFSRSNGRTENSADVWGAARPWAVSVDDSHSLDLLAGPQIIWQQRINQEVLAKLFKLPDIARITIPKRTAGGSVATYRAVSTQGLVSRISGRTLRAAIPLKSGWIASIKPVGN